MKELLDRAERFLKEAEDDVKKGFFDFSVFHLEQALQLLLKHILAEKVGYFPKTHSLSVLKEEVKKVDEDFGKVLEDKRSVLRELERAYIGARYLPFEYEESEAKELLKEVKEIFERFKHARG